MFPSIYTTTSCLSLNNNRLEIQQQRRPECPEIAEYIVAASWPELPLNDLVREEWPGDSTTNFHLGPRNGPIDAQWKKIRTYFGVVLCLVWWSGSLVTRLRANDLALMFVRVMLKMLTLVDGNGHSKKLSQCLEVPSISTDRPLPSFGLESYCNFKLRYKLVKKALGPAYVIRLCMIKHKDKMWKDWSYVTFCK